ncbi:protein ROOT HAIR DEFECTIVE 3 homolog 1, partial [Striga asiatica]
MFSSDHHLVLLEWNKAAIQRKKRFMFDCRWAKMEDSQKVVERAWNKNVMGNPLVQIQNKIRHCRIEILQELTTFYENLFQTQGTIPDYSLLTGINPSITQ